MKEKTIPTVEELQMRLDTLQQDLADLQRRYDVSLTEDPLVSEMLKEMSEDTARRLQECSDAYTQATSRLSQKRLLALQSKDKNQGCLKNNRFRKLAKGALLVLKNGLPKALKLARRKIQFGGVQRLCTIDEERRNREANTVFSKDITFSILVPLYNTPVRYLDDMIRSVQAQTYPKWELCLADGSDSAHEEVGKRVNEFADNDPRIVYKKLSENRGISENTNACIEMATGDYISLFDHDDILHPSALFETMNAICEHGADFIYTDEATFEDNTVADIITFHFKPDYGVDTLRANNFICHFSSFSRELLNKAGYFRHEYDGSQDHDLILRLTENAKTIYHIRKLLYFWRSHKASVAADINSKPYAIQAGQRAVHDSIVRSIGYECTVTSSKAFPTVYNIAYELKDKPLVSIVISNADNVENLKHCLTSIVARSTYPHYEILIPENNTDTELMAYQEHLRRYPNFRLISHEEPCGYADSNNLAVSHAKGDYVLLLNGNTSVITEDWIEQLLMYAQREDVAAVGAKLLSSDNTVRHAGIILGVGTDRTVGYEHHGFPHDSLGYMGRLCYARNTSAVSGSCLLVRKSVYSEIGGMDASFSVAYSDVDFCLRLRKKGYVNVFTPLAQVRLHTITEGDANRSKQETKRFRDRWAKEIEQGDPYFSPHFSPDHSDFRLK